MSTPVNKSLPNSPSKEDSKSPPSLDSWVIRYWSWFYKHKRKRKCRKKGRWLFHLLAVWGRRQWFIPHHHQLQICHSKADSPQPWNALPTSLVGVSAVAVLNALINYCKWTKQVQKRKGRKKKYQVLSLEVRELTRTLKISGSIPCPR